MDDRERMYLMALVQIEKINQAQVTALIEYFGSAEEAWNRSRLWNKALPLSPLRLDEILDLKRTVNPEKIWEYSERIHAKTVSIEEEEYPECFRYVASPPYLLYYFGKLPEHDRFGITVVGARKSSNYGWDIAKRISGDLVQMRDVMIISGMAEGIDAAAHYGALEAGGYTVAVLGSGIDKPYPAINTELYYTLKQRGCVLSEYPFGCDPHSHHFPARNRLMSALGRGVLVVEGRERSGVFHTVNHSLEQGKDVFAVPGSIFAKSSYAPHFFIREGSAKLVTCAADILEDYFDLRMDEPDDIEEFDFSAYSPEEAAVLNAMMERPLSFDEIMSLLQCSASETSVLLTRWDIEGLIHQGPGKIYSLRNYINEVKNE